MKSIRGLAMTDIFLFFFFFFFFFFFLLNLCSFTDTKMWFNFVVCYWKKKSIGSIYKT